MEWTWSFVSLDGGLKGAWPGGISWSSWMTSTVVVALAGFPGDVPLSCDSDNFVYNSDLYHMTEAEQ